MCGGVQLEAGASDLWPPLPKIVAAAAAAENGDLILLPCELESTTHMHCTREQAHEPHTHTHGFDRKSRSHSNGTRECTTPSNTDAVVVVVCDEFAIPTTSAAASCQNTCKAAWPGIRTATAIINVIAGANKIRVTIVRACV